MYSVDKFIEKAALISNTPVSKEVIEEIVAVREARNKIVHPVLSEDEIFTELVEFLGSHASDDGSVGLKYFVVNYLGSQNYEINHSYAHINSLAESGLVEIFKKERNGIASTHIRLPQND